jgi:16S rRNA (cytosine1402-N4)-methyltransferase
MFGERAILKKSSYIEMAKCVSDLGWHKVDGIVLDLGLSSQQLEKAERGFSFNLEGPLDMRFDSTEELRADDIVNGWSQHEIAKILYELGDETQGNKIARALVSERPIKSTVQLAQIVANCKRHSKFGRHVATKTFQALRIAVNKEIDNIVNVLPKALEILAPGGRIAIIAFHSLEDRLVKRFFSKESQDCICPVEQIICVCNHRATITRVNRRPISPTDREITENRRSRSARLRVAEKI